MTWWSRLVGWFRGIFKPRPLLRDVSRLDAGSDAVDEVVSADPVPWKPGRRRIVYRDPRLLPKPRKLWKLGKPPKALPADEARRLFAGTLRTKNRAIRDLLPDVAQLARLGLPVWKTEADVAAALDISVGMLRHLSIHRFRERTPHYVQYAIPKRSGGERLITAPKRRLKAVQRRLLPLLVDKLPLADPAHGFRAGRSIRSGAEPHVGKAVLLHMDLADFFHQVTYPRVRGYLIGCGYGFPVAATLAALCTESERQPVELAGGIVHVPVGPRRCVQGAPTSPGLCNAIAAKLDRRLTGLAAKRGFVYTRYADDLAFSGDDPDRVYGLVPAVRRIAGDEGFPVNLDKTRIMRRGQRQTVTGVVVNDVLGLSRADRRVLRAVIHRATNGGAPTLDRAELEGKLAYLAMLNPEQAKVLAERLR